MRSLLRNLTEVLAGNDPRWLAFGFNMPGISSTPGKPVNVSAQLADGGFVLVTWEPVALATRYRVRSLLVGRETEYSFACSVVDAMGMIKNLMPGDTVQIVVQAVNGRSQGVMSDPIQFTIPAVGSRSEAAEVLLATPHANGNGNGHSSLPNGKSNGSRRSQLVG